MVQSIALEQQILDALQMCPASADTLYLLVDPETTVDQFQEALYQLREQKFWVEKHGIVSGGCKTCACGFAYVYRLTISGRQHLREVQAT
jgi:hypothetical protein